MVLGQQASAALNTEKPSGHLRRLLSCVSGLVKNGAQHTDRQTEDSHGEAFQGCISAGTTKGRVVAVFLGEKEPKEHAFRAVATFSFSRSNGSVGVAYCGFHLHSLTANCANSIFRCVLPLLYPLRSVPVSCPNFKELFASFFFLTVEWGGFKIIYQVAPSTQVLVSMNMVYLSMSPRMLLSLFQKFRLFLE